MESFSFEKIRNSLQTEATLEANVLLRSSFFENENLKWKARPFSEFFVNEEKWFRPNFNVRENLLIKKSFNSMFNQLKHKKEGLDKC